jgi:hypothetical protein
MDENIKSSTLQSNENNLYQIFDQTNKISKRIFYKNIKYKRVTHSVVRQIEKKLII